MKDGSRNGIRKRLQLESAPRQRTAVYLKEKQKIVSGKYSIFRASVKERKSHVRRLAEFLGEYAGPIFCRVKREAGGCGFLVLP